MDYLTWQLLMLILQEEMSEDTDGEEEEGKREDGDDENVERIENGDK